MKRFICTVTVFFLTFVIASAQTDDVTLNIRLFPIQIIEVNSIQEVINLDYRTSEDNANGVQIDQPDHLRMYSTGGFTVKVNANNTNLTHPNRDVIPVSDILISPEVGTVNPLIGAVFTPVNLSNSATTIITNNTGGINKTFGINYRAKGNNEYVNKHVNIENPTIFTTNIIYSIETR